MTSKLTEFKLRANARHFSDEELLKDLKLVAQLLDKESIYNISGKRLPNLIIIWLPS